MSSLPDSEDRFLTAEELLAIRGTPEFESEMQRQMYSLAEWARQHPEEFEFWESVQSDEGWE